MKDIFEQDLNFEELEDLRREKIIVIMAIEDSSDSWFDLFMIDFLSVEIRLRKLEDYDEIEYGELTLFDFKWKVKASLIPHWREVSLTYPDAWGFSIREYWRQGKSIEDTVDDLIIYLEETYG